MPVAARTPLAPASSRSRNASVEHPSAETTPRPEIATGVDTTPYVSIASMVLQRARRAPCRFTLCWLILYAALVAIGPAIASARDLFDDIHARSRPVAASLRTISARFVEETTSPLLSAPLVARGSLVVVRPSRISLRYTEPDARTIDIDGDVLTVTWPSRRIRQTTDISASQRRVQTYFIDKSPAELRRHFTISAAVAPDRSTTWLVTMVPTRKQIRQGVTKLELWVSQQTFLPEVMRLSFPSGGTKRFTFEDVKTNVN
jgi:outer membrane lipoprotein-sorting protein